MLWKQPQIDGLRSSSIEGETQKLDIAYVLAMGLIYHKKTTCLGLLSGISK
jgi:hypothetical protein